MVRNFQGKPVSVDKLQLSGGAKELVFGTPPKLDQIVSITIEGRVTGVDHRVNEQSGDLEAIVRVKAIEIADITELSAPDGATIHHLPSAEGSP
jgi:hypothetical protein